MSLRQALKNSTRNAIAKCIATLKETKRQWNKKKSSQMLIILAAFAAGLIIPSRMAITLTPSLKHRVYFISRVSDKTVVRKNDYVLFRMAPNKYVENKRNLDVMKIAVCVGGETLTESKRLYYCNGEYLGVAKEMSLKGEKVDNFKFNGVIPADHFFVMGQHKDSYDSRYFGFVERKDVKATAHPIL